MSVNPWEMDWSGGQPAAPAPMRSQPVSTRREDEKVSQAQAFFSSAADAATLGAGDEIAGGLDAARAAIRGADAGDAYRRRVQLARENLRRAREDRPLTSMAGSLVGAGATFLVPGVGAAARGGKAIQAAAKARGLKGLGAQTYLGATRGAAFGGIYGANSGEDDLESRTKSAISGAGMGAAFGAAAPAVFQGAARVAAPVTKPINERVITPAREAIQRAFQQPAGVSRLERMAQTPPKAAPDQPRNMRAPEAVGANVAANAGGGRTGGLPPAPPPAPPPALPPIDDRTVASIDKMMARNNMTPDALEETISGARAQPAGRVLADQFGPEGQAKTKALAQSPGQTSGRAREVADARAQALPTRLIDEMRTRMGVRATPTQARRALSAEYAAASKEGYAPVLAQDVAPAAMNRLAPILARFPERVTKAASEIMDDLARADGIDAAKMTGAQRVHYLKMALDDAITSVESATGIRAATRTALRGVKRDFLAAVEGDEAAGIAPIVPGYKQARERWGSLKDAEEALDEGTRAFERRPEEVRDTLAQMTPFEREHYRIAVADEAARKLMRAAREVGQTNAANALNSRELQDVLEAAFENPQQAAQFLERLNEGNRLMRNASSWAGGSDTVSKASQLADEGLVEAVEATANAVQNPISAGKNALVGAVRAVNGPAMERQRDALGRAMLTAIDDGDEEAALFIQALLGKLRVREGERAKRAAEAGRSGAIGAIGSPDE